MSSAQVKHESIPPIQVHKPLCRQKADGKIHEPCIHMYKEEEKLDRKICGTCVCTCSQTPATYPKCT